jgi:hypothetical protein
MEEQKMSKKTFRIQARVGEDEYRGIVSLVRPEDETFESRAIRRVIRAGLTVLLGDKVYTKKAGQR